MKQNSFLISLSPLINLLSLTVLLLHPKPSSCKDPSHLACSYPRTKTCGDGQDISFPFYIQGKQDPFCGFPGFNLSCNNKGQPILELGNNDYIVRHISYNNQSIRVSNAAIFDTNSTTSCLPPIQNISLPKDRFNLATNQTDLFLLYNCSSASEVLLKYKVNCSEDGVTGSTLAVFKDNLLLDSMSMECKSVVEVPVDYMEGAEGNVRGVTGLLERGFLLNWVASNCSPCEASGGKCGFDNTTYQFMCFCPDQPHASHCPPGNSNSRTVVAIAASSTGFGVTILVICCLVWRHWLSTKNQTQEEQSIEAFLSKNGPLATKRYRYSEIKKITESYRDKLGEGGFGSVFKGKLPDGQLVAVKVLKESKGNGEEFINEVASIGRTSHVNIVNLLGFCFEGSKRTLIYEFMPNGSLEKYIHRNALEADCQLGLEALHQIALGIARGLEYLHRGCNTRILHFDIKPRNILLDINFCPKISDFGLAKICPQRESIISMLGARGTAGYIAPEVFCRNFGGVSHKSDVYSYGMMVLDMVGVGGVKKISIEVDNSSDLYFPDWIYKRLELGEELGLHEIKSEDENQLARRMIIVGLWCIQTKPSDRPPISRVIEMLQGSVQPLLIPPRPHLASLPRSPQRSEEDSSSTLLHCDSLE